MKYRTLTVRSTFPRDTGLVTWLQWSVREACFMLTTRRWISGAIFCLVWLWSLGIVQWCGTTVLWRIIFISLWPHSHSAAVHCTRWAAWRICSAPWLNENSTSDTTWITPLSAYTRLPLGKHSTSTAIRSSQGFYCTTGVNCFCSYPLSYHLVLHTLVVCLAIAGYTCAF